MTSDVSHGVHTVARFGDSVPIHAYGAFADEVCGASA